MVVEAKAEEAFADTEEDVDGDMEAADEEEEKVVVMKMRRGVDERVEVEVEAEVGVGVEVVDEVVVVAVDGDDAIIEFNDSDTEFEAFAAAPIDIGADVGKHMVILTAIVKALDPTFFLPLEVVLSEEKPFHKKPKFTRYVRAVMIHAHTRTHAPITMRHCLISLSQASGLPAQEARLADLIWRNPTTPCSQEAQDPGDTNARR
jgi:hypothetical protein